MVREITVGWNTLQISAELMYKKLLDLGFTCREGKIDINGDEASSTLRINPQR